MKALTGTVYVSPQEGEVISESDNIYLPVGYGVGEGGEASGI